MLKIVIENNFFREVKNMMSFAVINKNNDTMYEVYDVQYNKAGYPHFLIYRDGQWLTPSAKYFRPLEQRDYDELFGIIE